MEFNFLAILVTALVPMNLGFIWYNSKVFGNVWLRESELTATKINRGNRTVMFIASLLLSLLLAFFTNFLVIHELGVYGLTGGELNDPTTQAFLAENAGRWRTFHHGAIHGAMAGFMFAMPIIAINGLLERKSLKYIAIHAGYWIVCLTIMGSIISGWTV